jgi:hypothetical protein
MSQEGQVKNKQKVLQNRNKYHAGAQAFAADNALVNHVSIHPRGRDTITTEHAPRTTHHAPSDLGLIHRCRCFGNGKDSFYEQNYCALLTRRPLMADNG